MAESNKIKLYFVVLLAFLTALTTVLAIIAGLYALPKFIDSRIDKAINNTEFVRKIASHVRPYIIFDTNETILLDRGGWQYLKEKPKVIFADKDLEGDFQVIVTPKDCLHQAPLIESLCTCEFIISWQRGKGFEWIYYLDFVEATIHWEEGKNPLHKFRLEIIR